MRKWFPRGLVVGCAAVLAIAGLALAAQSTITVLDSTGATKTYVVTTNGSGNFLANIVLCDFSAGANCATVNSSNQLGVIEANSAAILSAISAPVPTNPKTTTQAKVTIAVTSTYQQALASSASRVGCTIQYIAVAGTKGYVFFGAAPGDTTTSFQLTNGQSLNCAIGGVAVAQDAVQVTATGTDIFVISNQ